MRRENRRLVRFQYPVFAASGFECFLQVEADVEFAAPAEKNEYGRPTECATDGGATITSLMFLDENVVSGISLDALPKEMVSEIEEMAYEKAVQEIEYEVESY